MKTRDFKKLVKEVRANGKRARKTLARLQQAAKAFQTSTAKEA